MPQYLNSYIHEKLFPEVGTTDCSFPFLELHKCFNFKITLKKKKNNLEVKNLIKRKKNI